MSGLALIDKAGDWPTGNGPDGDTTHPLTIVAIGLGILLVMPLVWGLFRRHQGLPMFGQPTIAQIEAPAGSPAAKRAARAARKSAAARRAAQAGLSEAPAAGGPPAKKAARTPAQRAAARKRAAAKAQAAAQAEAQSEGTATAVLEHDPAQSVVPETKPDGLAYDEPASRPGDDEASVPKGETPAVQSQTIETEEPRPVR